MNIFDKTLVIIDMQTRFLDHHAAGKTIIPKILLLIQHAKQNDWPIILVEFAGFLETDPEITDELQDYPHMEVITKSVPDGGEKVIECINNRPAWPLNLLMCGIFGNECVAATVRGAFDASNLVEIDIVGDAVFPEYDSFCKLDEGINQERLIYLDDILERSKV